MSPWTTSPAPHSGERHNASPIVFPMSASRAERHLMDDAHSIRGYHRGGWCTPARRSALSVICPSRPCLSNQGAAIPRAVLCLYEMTAMTCWWATACLGAQVPGNIPYVPQVEEITGRDKVRGAINRSDKPDSKGGIDQIIPGVARYGLCHQRGLSTRLSIPGRDQIPVAGKIKAPSCDGALFYLAGEGGSNPRSCTSPSKYIH